MTEKYDVVVIGAGLGGLSAAGYLAKAGKSVLVLEHHDVPGGYAHEFRRGHYRFKVALHALDGAAPGGWAYAVLSDLDVLNAVRFRRLDPFYVARFPHHQITVDDGPFKQEEPARTWLDTMRRRYERKNLDRADRSINPQFRRRCRRRIDRTGPRSER